MTSTALNPYANALALPFATGRAWFRQAYGLWLRHWLFFGTGALLTLGIRWQLDGLGGGTFIVLSYFTDAGILGLLYVALREHQSLPESPFLLFLVKLKTARLKQVALCGLWGLPAAAASLAILVAGPEMVNSLVYLVGSNLLGHFAMLLAFLVGGFAAFLAALLPNLAAIQTVRDPSSTFRSAGLWAFRGMRSGWRPLAVVFMAFVTASFAAGALLTPILGHLPAAYLTGESAQTLLYWFPWPGLFVAMNLFIALLFPMADTLMQAADHDLSDEVFDTGTRDKTSAEFVAHLLDQTGFAIASLAAFGILFWGVANLLMQSSGYGDSWLLIAIVGFLWSRSWYKSAGAWREHASWLKRYRFLWMLPALLGLGVVLYQTLSYFIVAFSLLAGLQ